jgi:hypothetical protein
MMIRHRVDGQNCYYPRVVSRCRKARCASPTNRAVYPEDGYDSTAHIEMMGHHHRGWATILSGDACWRRQRQLRR